MVLHLRKEMIFVNFIQGSGLVPPKKLKKESNVLEDEGRQVSRKVWIVNVVPQT